MNQSSGRVSVCVWNGRSETHIRVSCVGEQCVWDLSPWWLLDQMQALSYVGAVLLTFGQEKKKKESWHIYINYNSINTHKDMQFNNSISILVIVFCSAQHLTPFWQYGDAVCQIPAKMHRHHRGISVRGNYCGLDELIQHSLDPSEATEGHVKREQIMHFISTATTEASSSEHQHRCCCCSWNISVLPPGSHSATLAGRQYLTGSSSRVQRSSLILLAASVMCMFVAKIWMRGWAASRVGGPQHFSAVTSAAPVAVITVVTSIIREGTRGHVIQRTVRLLQHKDSHNSLSLLQWIWQQYSLL